jgi:flagellar export protein FliJ
MKRNRFRLATVLRVRTVQEDVELGRLSHARADAQRASEHAERSLDRYVVRAQHRATTNTEAFLAGRAHLDRLADSVVISRADVAVANGIVQERRVDWSHAAQRVSALDRLRDRHDEAFAAAARLEEVADADERTTTRGRVRHDLHNNNFPPSEATAEPR